MFHVRTWERFQFFIDSEHEQVLFMHSIVIKSVTSLTFSIRTAQANSIKTASEFAKTIDSTENRKSSVFQGLMQDPFFCS
jgi:hypothetical protein